MKSYITYKNQMQGVKDVSETVKTVEKIAASSVHLLKQEVSMVNTYADEIERTLARLSLFYMEEGHYFLKRKKDGRKALLIITGDKGLVGGLWHGVVNTFLQNVERDQDVMVLGIKGENYLKEEGVSIKKSFSRLSEIPQKEEIKNITNYLLGTFERGVFPRVDILYPQFISLVEQVPVILPFLPFKFTLTKGKNTNIGLPIFEPSKRAVFDNLLRKYIGVFFYKIIMEAKLSEISARTVAMEHAAAKTEELVQKMILDYTKERRRIVTQRQLESFTAHKMI